MSSASSPASAQELGENITAVLGFRVKSLKVALGEVTVIVAAADYLSAATQLRDAAGGIFEQLIDLCGLDWHVGHRVL